jgi:N6-L-threonylcarbamoyladenine synthase
MHGLAFPYLLLLVSGGHSQFVWVRGVGDYELWGTTIDDALGEAFDKVAKLLALGHPGGPEVEKAALRGDPDRFRFPRPLLREERLDFSFSGLKTAVRLAAEAIAPLTDQDVYDIAAGFQAAVVDVVATRAGQALDKCRAYGVQGGRIVVAGGVAANRAIAAALDRTASDRGFALVVPPLNLCTDNGAMVAWAGAERLALGRTDASDFAARPRWPLVSPDMRIAADGA